MAPLAAGAGADQVQDGRCRGVGDPAERLLGHVHGPQRLPAGHLPGLGGLVVGGLAAGQQRGGIRSGDLAADHRG